MSKVRVLRILLLVRTTHENHQIIFETFSTNVNVSNVNAEYLPFIECKVSLNVMLFCIKHMMVSWFHNEYIHYG